MTSAEFDTLRRYLGLSIQETADFVGVQRRTVERWISGKFPVTPSAANKLNDLERSMKQLIDDIVNHDFGSSFIRLFRYHSKNEIKAAEHGFELPLGAHAMLVASVADALKQRRFEVQIEWSTPRS